MQNAKLRAVALSLVLYAACKDAGPEPRASVVEVSPPATRSALANSVVSPDIVVRVQDPSGNPMAGQSVEFAVVQGGGTLTGISTVTTDANGTATAPAWRLGKSTNGSGGQIMRVKSGTLDSLEIKATVTSSYNIAIRFFDDASMTSQQKLLFTQAAARIQGVIVGDVASVTFNNDVSGCLKQNPGTTILAEQVDDLIIYASVKPIDGPNNVVASASACVVRQPGATTAASDYTPVLGVMTFDAADIASLTADGHLQDVIIHEMLHVVGLGTLWECNTSNLAYRCFVENAGTTNPLYSASQARASCVAIGGTDSCATRVPLEGCLGIPSCQPDPNDSGHGAGTRDAHWRESTFGTEIMTGFSNPSDPSMPFSSVTIGALADIGYTVNANDYDTYTIASGSIAASSLRAPMPASPTMRRNWESLNTLPLYSIDHNGKMRLIRKAQ